MQDDFTPVRYDLHHASGEGRIEADDQGLYVGYTDFLTARHSRDHWKARAARWEAEAKNQERVIQNLESVLRDAHAREDALKSKLAQTLVSENELRLVQMLADINAISFKAITK